MSDPKLFPGPIEGLAAECARLAGWCADLLVIVQHGAERIRLLEARVAELERKAGP